MIYTLDSSGLPGHESIEGLDAIVEAGAGTVGKAGGFYESDVGGDGE